MYTNYKDIKEWLDENSIKNYTIDYYDSTVNVNGNVWLFSFLKKFTEIPVQFNIVNGYFYCYDNNLTSLKGCPKIVNGHFDCKRNKLTSLEYLPIVKGHLMCDDSLKESIEYKRWKLMNTLRK